MTQTYSDKLTEVQNAITAITTNAQTVATVNGQSYTYATLDTLYRMETHYRRMVDRDNAGGIRVNGATPT